MFAAPAADPEGPRRGAARAAAAASCTRKQIDDYTAFVARYGAKGLAYIKVNDAAKGRDGLQSPILKFLSRRRRSTGILERTGAADGDLIFFGADTREGRQRRARRAAPEARARPRARAKQGWQPLWVVDFPMFEWDADAKRWVAMHHPFTAPAIRRSGGAHGGPDERRWRSAYDMVLNGSEIGGGSVRIHRQEMQSRCSTCSASAREEAQIKFGFLLEALKLRRAAARRHRLRPRPARRC